MNSKGPPPFQETLDAYAQDVHRFLVFLVGPQEADDCFQETFLSALKAYPRLKPDSNIRAWLFTIARNKANDRFRAKKRGPEPVAELELEHVDSHHDAPDGQIWSHVKSLPEKQRLAIAYRYAGDLSYEEIAEAMGSSKDSARQNVSTGLKSLRRVVKHV